MADMNNIKKWGTDNLTGILALIAGLILLAITYTIVIKLIIFSLGLVLVYFGLAKMKIESVTRFLDNMMNKLKSMLSDRS